MSRSPLAAVLALAVLACPRSAPAAAAEHPLRQIKAERLVYSVRARQRSGLVTMNIGTCTFTLRREQAGDEEQLVLLAEAKGGIPGFPYEATMTSRLRAADFQPREFFAERTQKSYKKRWIRFHERGTDYLKHTHCDVPALCHRPAHRVERDDGTRAHCPGCNDRAHYVWSLRYRHRHTDRVYDILGPLYVARGMPIEVGGAPQTIRVLSKRDMFDVAFTAQKEGTLTLPIGKIPCYKMVLSATPANDHARKNEEFEGFFGLHGNVQLYIDKQTHHMLLVRGKVTLGATFDVEVVLSERSVERLPASTP